MCPCHRFSMKSCILSTSPCLRSWKKSLRWPRSVPSASWSASSWSASSSACHCRRNALSVCPRSRRESWQLCRAHHEHVRVPTVVEEISAVQFMPHERIQERYRGTACGYRLASGQGRNRGCCADRDGDGNRGSASALARAFP